MSPRPVFHPAAVVDLSEAVDWYAANAGREIAQSFSKAVRDAVRAIAAHPHRFPLLEDDVHHLVLQRFPYSVLYTVEAEAVLIVSVFHQRRHPADWQTRL